jgi:methylated-DNA-[protein]-cysteine S-methyltransferase|tara:strand:- start:795 stop:1247 length:453 start_codon:yes stop_codon:yes gene_type:complete
MINKISVKTKMGWISIFEENRKIFKVKFGKTKNKSESKVLNKFKEDLLKFYSKKKPNINAKSIMTGNLIQKKVWGELKKIKTGHTKSYGEIAKKFNISPRHVGKICSQNKLLLLIPCHRVIKSDGSLGGFSSLGGIGLKKKLLDFEKKWK